MSKTISLSAYVKKRNGVALGGSGPMQNMLSHSLVAGSFYLFKTPHQLLLSSS